MQKIGEIIQKASQETKSEEAPKAEAEPEVRDAEVQEEKKDEEKNPHPASPYEYIGRGVGKASLRINQSSPAPSPPRRGPGGSSGTRARASPPARPSPPGRRS